MPTTYIKAVREKMADGRIRFVASDETMDRSGEIVPAEAWDLSNFKKSPRILVDHDYRVEAIVGKAPNTYMEGKRLITEPVFHEHTELAKTVKKMVEDGFLDTMSVGFLRKSDAKGKVSNELMEISFVAVPANPNARMLSVTPDAEKAIKSFVGDEAPVAAPEPEAVEPEAATEPAPAAEEAKKGVIDDTNEAAHEACERKWPVVDRVWCAFDSFFMAYRSDAVAPESYPEFISDLCAKLDAIAKGEMPVAGEPMFASVQESIMKGLAEHAAKAGRVLSEKSRGTIQSAIDAQKSSIGALEELLNAAEPQGTEVAKSEAAQAAEAEAGHTAKEEASTETDASRKEIADIVAKRALLRAASTYLGETLSKLKFN